MSDVTILLGALFVYMNAWFAVSVATSRNDVADIAWGLGFVGIAWLSFVLGESAGWQTLIINTLVTVWGVRLAWHIFSRHRKGAEDSRYLAWRQTWGRYFYLRSYFQIFILQGLLLFVVSLPIVFVNLRSVSESGVFLAAGIAIFCMGFLFEAIADGQLRSFLANPANRGKLMRSGLWRYSRHPNYFGEVMLWWGIGVASLGTGTWWGLVGPATITILIVFVSGIPMLETKYSGRSDWEEYRETTSVFFPWIPKK